MTDTTVTAAAPAATDSTAPVITAASYHPDHPGPIGWLIYELHERLSAVEAALGISTPAVAPVVVPTTPTGAATTTPSPSTSGATPAAAPATHESVMHTIAADLEAVAHKIESEL